LGLLAEEQPGKEEKMKKRTSILLGSLVALLCVPIGFAVAQSTLTEPDVPVAETNEDPDPSTDPVQELDALNKAVQAGDAAAEAQAAEAMRQEILSRSSQTDREAAESAPPEEEVPPGTITYLAPSMPDEVVSQCEENIAKGEEDELCELIVLRNEGKIRSGAFTAEQQSATLREAR
jgi:hypothetical protein